MNTPCATHIDSRLLKDKSYRHRFYKLIWLAAFTSMLTYGRSVSAQQVVPREDYEVYEVALGKGSKPLLLLPRTVPIDGRKNLKIWYQPEGSREKLKNLRPGRDSLWVWEDSLRMPRWRELLLHHNSLGTADSLQLDKTLFTRQKVYNWPSDANALDQQVMDTIRGTDWRDVARKRAQFKSIQEFSRSYYHLSRITYSPDGRSAMVYIAHYCGGRCGSGSLVFLEKLNGVWKHYYTRTIWVS